MREAILPTNTAATDPAGWVDRHGDYLFRYALARVGRAELAEDLVQEAFLGALRNREQFAGASSEQTWLIGILKRKIVDHHRRQQREQPAGNLGEGGWIDELFDESGHWKKGPGHWTSPSASYENAEFWTTFRRCLSRLTPRLAEAFSLREIDDMPSEEICKVLTVSATNLNVMMHRARLQLWRCLDIHWFGGTGGE
jgi:RNA polymerase sigma-70 factor, ECF subfamily